MPTNADTHFTAHKFRKLDDHFWDNLEGGRVYFSAPDSLNDPFDCRIDLVKALRLARSGMEGLTDAALAHWKVVANTIAERASTCGVLSLSAGDLCGSNEQLLWSHYADNHKGVAVTYEIPYEFINGLVGCSPVTYDPNGLLEALRSLDLSKKLDFETGVKPVVTRFLTTKASHWEYECEARLISFKPGPVNIQREWVRQICFGLNTPLDDRAKVIDRTQQFGYSACQFAEVVHSDNGLFDFELREVAGH